ncbi:MAG: amidohydrolase, partial [Saprospiraceae bacterium]|nr:amidohydrolase [Saprospiraceae bacterium]
MAKITWSSTLKYSVRGRIVTLDSNSTVIDDGIVYIEGDTIKHVQDAAQGAPNGWRKIDAITSSGTIYPGMIELHNHLAYNIIPCWNVPKAFKNRDQWRRHSDYTKKMTGPLRILGSLDGYLQAIVRFTECKLLFSGVTASQGITLASSPGIRSLYKGVVRNVEQT